MAREIKHSDLYEDGFPQKSVAILKETNKLLLDQQKKFIKELNDLQMQAPKGVTAQGIRAQQNLANKIDITKKNFRNLSAAQKESIRLQKLLVKEDGKATKKNIQLAAAIQRRRIQTRKLIKDQAGLNQSNKRTGRGLTSMLGGLAKSAGALGALLIVLRILTKIAKAIFNTTRELDALRFSMDAIIDSSVEFSGTQQFLVGLTQKFGVELISATQAYVRFRAAIKSTNISAIQAQDIFQSVTKAGAVLGLSQQRLALAFLALEQIASKGTVSMEELRRQLGDQIPGAVQIMADALDVTVPKLFKMIKANEVLAEDALPAFARELEIAYGIENVTKVDTINAAIGRFQTSWKLLIEEIKASRFITVVINGIAKAVGILTDLFKTDYEKKLAEQFDAAAKSAKDFTFELTSTTDQYVRSLNTQIKQLKILNNTLDTTGDEYKNNVSSIQAMESEIKSLTKTGKDVFKGEELSSAIRDEINRAESEANKATKLLVEMENQLLSLKEKKETSVYLTNKDAEGIVNDITELNSDISDELGNKAWYVQYADQLKLRLADADKTLEEHDPLGILGLKRAELKKELDGLDALSKGELALANARVEGLKREIGLLEDLGTIKSVVRNAKRDLEIHKAFNKTKVDDIKNINEEILNEETKRINEIADKEVEFLDLSVDINENYTTDLIKIEQGRYDKLEKLREDYHKSVVNQQDLELQIWEEKNRSILEDAERLTKALVDQEALRIQEGAAGEKDLLDEKLSRDLITQTQYDLELIKLENKTADAIKKIDQDLIDSHGELIQDLAKELENLSQTIGDIFLQLNDANIQIAEQELELHQNRLDEIESAIDKELQLKMDGKNNEYDLLVTQQQKEKQLRDKAFEDLKELKKKEAKIQLAQQTASLITASAKILEGTAKDPVTLLIALGTIAGMISAFIGYKNKIKAIESEEPGFAEGVIDFKGKGTRTSDSNRVRMSNRESMITAKGTEKAPKALTMINDGKLADSDIFNTYRLNMPNILGVGGKDDYYSRQLLKVASGTKEATENLHKFMKYESAQIMQVGDNKILIKQGTKLIEATLPG